MKLLSLDEYISILMTAKYSKYSRCVILYTECIGQISFDWNVKL